ncbi:hypothetical protein AJ80_03666 [Polytolypa hystricis UAMH7299]|uniref:Major facilitator superfamily (MFS) profile domain-containing protein n=1 Tax=Polytolypa hystricis (strain UAMH7299) TaxID=1447883 RepID=A0A2B7YGQ2_POLH7|nr:hypothetical protein AJ80_03666 [Polytolypa hystricis UAMH7299]
MTSKGVENNDRKYDGDINPEQLEQQIENVNEKNDDTGFTEQEQKNIMRRIDYRVIVPLGAMYCVSLIDRGNLPNASIAGMNVDLDLSVGYRYSTIALVFFVTYTIFQPLATLMVRHFGPRLFLPTICLCWGVLLIGFGFVKNWVVMIPLRLLLGLLEAGCLPGSAFLIQTWYTRYEVHTRFSWFYVLGFIASAFSNILAYGLSQMEGVGGLRGWRWIFIIEGILTCVITGAAYICLVDFPDRIKGKSQGFEFLRDDECDFVLSRINKDRGDAVAEPWSFKLWISSGADWRLWNFALISFCSTMVAYALGYFMPIILRENMGFSLAASQCLTAPPYVFAAIVMVGEAWVGDKYHIRGPILIFNACLAFIGLPIFAFAGPPGVRYFGIFLVTASCYPSIPTLLAYQANNVRGYWKRAFMSALGVGFTGVGGVAGTLVFRSQDSPSYRPGVYSCLASNGLQIILVTINIIAFRRYNQQASRGKRVLEGDPDFRYTI